MAKYLLKDNNGRTLATLPGVLDPVALTGVETSSSSNLVTVASTTGLYAGMAVSIPNIPAGALIHAVKSTTVIELWASSWDATNGVFTTSAANANASATATGMLGSAQGFNARCRVSEFYARGTWRNTHRLSTNFGAGTFAGAGSTGLSSGSGQAFIPSAKTITTGYYTITNGDMVATDELAATPLKRHNGEPWSFYIVVHTSGHQSIIPAAPDQTLHYNGPDA
jgi:hypothetical protein